MTAEILAADAAGVRRAAELLRAGEVIGFPTDTVYGLAALARDRRANQRIFEVKRRDRSQQLIAMAPDPSSLDSLVDVTPRARTFMDRWWPGPLTLVLPARGGESPTLGVRIPDHPVALALLRAVGEPLATTSANLSGCPPAMSALEAARLEGLAAVLDGGPAPGGQASTVLSLVGPDVEVLRAGPVPEAEARLHELAARFRTFADVEAAGSSPLYQVVCSAVAGRPDVLALTLAARPGQRRPNLLLAAVHYLLLSGIEDALAAFYPSLGGGLTPAAEAGERFCAFVLAHAGQVRELIRTRRTQTNEVGRCTALVLGLARLDGPLALIDVGASAGLNLNLDRYAYDYGPAGSLVPTGAELTLPCRPRGALTVPPSPPRIVWRAGIDLHPLDPRDPETVRWLRALVWPEQIERLHRLDQALAVAHRHPAAVRTGDAIEVLPEVVREAPGDATLVVMHANTLIYNPGPVQERFRAVCRELGAHVLGAEGVPGEPWARNLLTLDWKPLAYADPHGAWIEWLS